VASLALGSQNSGMSSEAASAFVDVEKSAAILRSRYKSELASPAVARALAAAHVASRGAAALAVAGAGTRDLATTAASLPSGAGRVSALLSAAECALARGDLEAGIKLALDSLRSARSLPAAASQDAKELLLAVFELLGTTHPLVAPGRKELSKALFR
jgi:thioredoxin-like negative regulator of GroEL